MTNKSPEEIAKLNAYRAEGGKFGTRPHPEAPVTIDAPVSALLSEGDEIFLPASDGKRMQRVTVIADNGEDGLLVEDADGGEFAAPRTDVRTGDQATQAIIDALQADSRKFTLAHVSYDDELMPDQIVHYLSGDMESFDQIYENWGDHRWQTASEEIDSVLTEFGLDEDDDQVDRELLREFIQDQDDSDIQNELIRGTSSQLMRTRLGHVHGEGTYSGHDDAVWPAREARIAEMLAEHGLKVETDEQREAINELVHNGPYEWHDGVRLEVIFQGDIRDATVWNKDAGDVQDRRITFESPYILLIDTVNGSGHDVKLPGSLTATVTPDRPAMLDKKPDWGYSWDDVAGVVHSAYRTDVKTEWVPAPDKEDQAA